MSSVLQGSFLAHLPKEWGYEVYMKACVGKDAKDGLVNKSYFPVNGYDHDFEDEFVVVRAKKDVFNVFVGGT